MRAKGLTVTICIVFIAGLLLSLRIVNTRVNTDVDIVAVNEAVKTVEQHWGRLEQGDYRSIRLPFAVMDINGNILFQTADNVSPNLNEAIRNRDTIADVQVAGQMVGKLVLHNDYETRLQHDKRTLMAVISATFTMIIILCVLYLLYMDQTVFKPFKRLQSFALNVARGNLDIPLIMDKRNPFGAFTESFDLMREELAAARKSEYEANRSKKELVASLSHDIKTPVASIKAVSELMLLRADDEKAIKQLNTIQAKAEQINRLVTDMFHATLEELQELKVVVAEELSSILDGIIANVNYDDQIRCGIIPDCVLLTDAMRLQQVFDNILSNSYKYAGTEVTIDAAIISGYLQLRIMDYGSGIREDELPLLFNKFYRGSNTGNSSGSGLGLFISKYLMQSMLGDITCHNRDGGFTVTLSIKLAGTN